jgi:hypothetical protein
VNEDLDIRKRFAAMRDEDAARIPGFEHVLLQRAHPKPYIRFRRFAAIACLLLAAGVASLLHHTHQSTTAYSVAAPSLAQWRAPTDFLLYTPGRELLYTIPQIGEAFSDELIIVPKQEPHS